MNSFFHVLIEYNNLELKKDFVTANNSKSKNLYSGFDNRRRTSIVKLFLLEDLYFELYTVAEENFTKNNTEKISFFETIINLVDFFISHNVSIKKTETNEYLESFKEVINAIIKLVKMNKGRRKESRKSLKEDIVKFINTELAKNEKNSYEIFLALSYNIRNNFVHNGLVADDGLKPYEKSIEQQYIYKLKFLYFINKTFEKSLLNIHFVLLKEVFINHKEK